MQFGDSPADPLDEYFGLKTQLETVVSRPVDLLISGSVRNPYVQETEDFDLAWCRGSGVSLAHTTSLPPERSSLMTVLQSVDSTFRLNTQKPYQALNASNYEVELLMAPSLAPLPKTEVFEPMVSLPEQEWLSNEADIYPMGAEGMAAVSGTARNFS